MSDEPVEKTVVVKKERPFLKFFLWAGVIISSSVVILFTIGFIMGSSGIRPPTLDPDTILGNTQTPDERENPHVDTDEEAAEHDEQAEEAGRQAGRLFPRDRDDLNHWWNGWNKGATEENDDGRRRDPGVEPPTDESGATAWAKGEEAGNLYNDNKWHRPAYWKGFNKVVETQLADEKTDDEEG